MNEDNVRHFSDEILIAFRNNVGKYAAETGGMIGSKKDESIIDLYEFDADSKNTPGSFYYNQEKMSVVYRDWVAKGYVANGFVHSHPIGAIRPSYHDISTALLHMNFWERDYFQMPIIQTNRNGNYTMYFYLVVRKEQQIIVNLQYVLKAKENEFIYSSFVPWKAEYSVEELNMYRKRIDMNDSDGKVDTRKTIITKVTDGYEYDELFSKIEFTIPKTVRDKVIICVGCGGAREYLENMARNGFNYFVLIEHDIVEKSNIATQAVHCSEIGKSKVEVLKKSILDINPFASVTCIDRFLDDDMSDEEFKDYMDIYKRENSLDYLILGCTDSFYAQERSAALALKYGTMYLSAMMYKNGSGAEIIFCYPGVTSSCPRCMLRQRYEMYEKGFENDVDSSSCTYFATSTMNAYKGYISLMMLCYGSNLNSEFANMLNEVCDRNFVWIKLSPSIREVIGIDLFDRVFGGAKKYEFFGEPIWLKQIPDSIANGSENCKLCGGVGDLRLLKNKWRDTRKICITSNLRHATRNTTTKKAHTFIDEKV